MGQGFLFNIKSYWLALFICVGAPLFLHISLYPQGCSDTPSRDRGEITLFLVGGRTNSIGFSFCLVGVVVG
jgi:hypothetical protein